MFANWACGSVSRALPKATGSQNPFQTPIKHAPKFAILMKGRASETKIEVKR
jgi:hypothetical protein